MSTWKEEMEREITRKKKDIALAEEVGLRVCEILEKHNIPFDPWSVFCTSIAVEIKSQEEVDKIPPEMIKELLELVGKFEKTNIGRTGQVYYTGITPEGFTIFLRVGPRVCKTKCITEITQVEEVKEFYIFEKDCDPLFLNESVEVEHNG